jgi:hypothetical protein
VRQAPGVMQGLCRYRADAEQQQRQHQQQQHYARGAASLMVAVVCKMSAARILIAGSLLVYGYTHALLYCKRLCAYNTGAGAEAATLVL